MEDKGLMDGGEGGEELHREALDLWHTQQGHPIERELQLHEAAAAGEALSGARGTDGGGLQERS
eukprot:3538951-Prymnesium_polylepis.1